MPGAWPLVGRDDELELIAEVLDRPDGARSMVLAGGAGVGKSRLAVEALALAAARGAPTARVVASRAASTIPLGALAPLLPDGPQTADSRLGLLRQVAAALAARATPDGGALLLAVDDAHLLDDASAALVHQVAAEGTVRLLLTIRSGEPVPDAVALLWKDGLAERLELQHLARPEIEALAAAALGGDVDGALVQHLWSASQGNALYLRELLLGAVESGAVGREGRLWRLHGGLGAPPRLVELVESRVADLAGEELEVLDLLSVGEQLGLAALEGVVGGGVLEDLERRGLITVTPDERRRVVRLAHPLYGEIRRRTLPATRLRNVQRRLADLVAAAGARRRDDILRMAILRLDADGHADAELLAEAARQAWYTYDIALEERLARAAVAAGAGISSLLLLAEILRWAGRHQEAEDLLRPVTPAEAGERNFAVICLTRAEVLFRGLDRYQEALDVIAVGLESVQDEAWRDELRAERASLQLFAGELMTALPELEAIAGRAKGRPLVAAAAVGVPALALRGRFEDALDLADRSFGVALELGRQPSMADPAVFVIGRCLALTYAGRLEEAQAPAQLGYDWSITTGVPAGQAWFGMVLGLVGLARGDLEMARARFDEAALAFRDQHDRSNWKWCLSGLSLAAAWRGDPAAARRGLREADALGMNNVALMDPEVDRAWAAVEAVEGDVGAARRRLAIAAERSRTRGARAHEAAVLHDLVRLAGPGSLDAAVVARLAQLEEESPSPLNAVRRAHADALAAGDGSRLEEVADRFEELGARLCAAEAAAHAAAAHRTAGVDARAAVLAARCRALAEECGGARTPAITAATSAAAHLELLTPREHEVARLAADGATNRQIAEQLFVSVRTVENQLQRAYTKLGVSGRAELRDALVRNE